MTDSEPRRSGRTAKRSAGKSAKKAAPPSSKKAKLGQAAGPTSPILEQLGPRLREEFEALSKSEAKILRALGREAIAEEFVRDPSTALRRMKVDVPPIMAARLKNSSLLSGLIAPRSYQLPNGQVVTARVTVRLTTGEPGGAGATKDRAPRRSDEEEG